MARNPSQPNSRPLATSVVLVLLLAGAVGLGIRQDRMPGTDRSGERGVVTQVQPDSAAHAMLPTAPEPGALAPNFRLPLAGGGEIELADLRGRPVFINFWASWCFFCLTEMPAIQRVSDEYGDEVVMLGVNVSDTPEDIALYAKNNHLEYPFPMDTEGEVREAYRARQMPTSVFVDPHGVVSSVVYGVIVPDQMREHIDAMLAPTATARWRGAGDPQAHIIPSMAPTTVERRPRSRRRRDVRT